MRMLEQMWSVTPLLNTVAPSASYIGANASRTPIAHLGAEPSTRKGSSGAHVAAGLALNAVGTAAAVSLLPAAGPAALFGATCASFVAPSAINVLLSCGPGTWAAPHPNASAWTHGARHAAWAVSHIAMGASLGLCSTPLWLLAGPRLAAGIAIGAGIPVAVYGVSLVQAAGQARSTSHAARAVNPQEGWPVAALQMDSPQAEAGRIVNVGGLALLMAELASLARLEQKIPGIALGSSLLCAGSVWSASARARNLALHADEIDPAASSLLLSSAVITSVLWGLQSAAIRYRSVWQAIIDPPVAALSGYGLPRSARLAG